jgi:hypothetical protein
MQHPDAARSELRRGGGRWTRSCSDRRRGGDRACQAAQCLAHIRERRAKWACAIHRKNNSFVSTAAKRSGEHSTRHPLKFRVLGTFKWVCQSRRLWDGADCGSSPTSLNRRFLAPPEALNGRSELWCWRGGGPAGEKDLPACGSAFHRGLHRGKCRFADMMLHTLGISLGVG